MADAVPVRRKAGFPFGIAQDEPLVPEGDDWWAPMNAEESDVWANGE